jgi:hypothetical protein
VVVPTARQMWALYEPIHDVAYFTPECRAAGERLGLPGFWMGYFAMRVAPLGAASPAVTRASFFGFHPNRIDKALPEAWNRTDPARALAARLAGVDEALLRLWGEAVRGSAELREAADLAWAAAESADTTGRVLAAANQALPRPDAPHLALWQAGTTLREHRGDGHNCVLVALGIGPVQAHAIKVATGSDAESLRLGRSWPRQDWQSAVEQLRASGHLDAAGRLTEAGQALHLSIEAATDRAAEQPWDALGERATQRLAELLTPLAAVMFSSGTVPLPNPVGLPTPDVIDAIDA